MNAMSIKLTQRPHPQCPSSVALGGWRVRGLRAALVVALGMVAAQASAEVVFFEQSQFQGRSFTASGQIRNFERYGFNDRASSVVVLGERWDRWEVCEDARFNGRCAVLRPGRYPSLAAMGLNDRVSSARNLSRNSQVDDGRYAPPPEAVYDSRRRNNERLYEADVTSVRAVMGTPQQRCWIEAEQVSQSRGDSGVSGAIAGALLGGILGHQIGGGSGRDIATAGGAVAGAAMGANMGREFDGQVVTTQNVRRCENLPTQGRPDFWEVSYTFRGQGHIIQMTNPPGHTVTVNGRGEPRN